MSAASNPDLMAVLTKAERTLERLEQLLRQTLSGGGIASPNWQVAQAWLYRRSRAGLGLGYLQAIACPVSLDFADLYEVDVQKAKIQANTQAFLTGRPANNVLLTGARGTGKSSLVKACLQAFASQGLRLVEMDKSDLADLPEVVELLRIRPEKFIIYCDDLSFEAGEGGYKALKSVLDGSLAGSSANVLVYATSNRRHLMPEYQSENLSYHTSQDGEIHPGEAVEEKTSLAERFGLWLSFYPFSQDEYLHIVQKWLHHFGVPDTALAAAQAEALVWALERGARNGRVAYQFAKAYSANNA